MKKQKYQFLGFTLVEIIVVITIISILGTLALISLSKYNSEARDTNRIVDVKSIETTLSFFHSYSGTYPSPENGVDVVLEDNGAIAWTQGVFGDESIRETGKILGDLRDPLYGNQYTYSITGNRREYQLAYMLEQSNNFWDTWRNGNTAYNILQKPTFIEKVHATSTYDPLLLNPIIWLDGNDIDGDGDTEDNPADGATVTTWVNKGTLLASGDATRTTGTVSYEDGSVNGDAGIFIPKSAGVIFNGSDITQGEIYYVLHDSGGKASGYALQGTVPNYLIGSYKNYRNALKISSSPSHINIAPAIRNSNSRQAFLYSFLTDGTNYEFRNTGNLISLGATNPVTGITWAMNKAGAYTKTSDLADWGIGEVLIFDTTLSPEEEFQLEGYLSWKWALEGLLPEDHPYKSAPPITGGGGGDPVDPGSPTIQIQAFPDAPIHVIGNYNHLISHGTTSAGTHVVFVTPSIIASDLSSTGFLDIIANKKLVYDGFENVPASYQNLGQTFTSTGGFDMHVESPIAFSGSRDDLASYSGIREIDSILRSTYSISPIYSFLSDNFENYGTYYVENVLADKVGINPIKPYYCSEILDKKLIYNVALDAFIDATPTSPSSGVSGTGGLNNGIKSTTGDLNYEYQANQTDGYIEFRWNSDVPLGFVRIYNTVGIDSDQLSGASIDLYRDGDVSPVYSHPLWDTSADYIVDLDLEGIGKLYDNIRTVRIEAATGATFNIREIELYAGGNIQDGYYTVDSDGIGGQASYQVYCDMTTDEGGWTRVGENFIDRGDFADLQDPSNFTGYYASGSVNNISENSLRSDITPPTETPLANVLRHSGGTNSYYELDFTDIPNVEFSSEIRLSAWVKGTAKSPLAYTIKYVDQSPASFQPEDSIDTGIWRYETYRISLTDVLESFTWEVGGGIDATGTPIDITGLSLELYYK